MALGKAVTASGVAASGAYQNITDGKEGDRQCTEGLFLINQNSWAQVDLSSTMDVERVVVIMPSGWHDAADTYDYTLQLLDASNRSCICLREFTEAKKSGTNKGTYTFEFDELAAAAGEADADAAKLEIERMLLLQQQEEIEERRRAAAKEAEERQLKLHEQQRLALEARARREAEAAAEAAAAETAKLEAKRKLDAKHRAEAEAAAAGTIKFIRVNSGSDWLFISQVLVYARAFTTTNIAREKAVTGSAAAVHPSAYQIITDGDDGDRSIYKGLCITGESSWVQIEMSRSMDVENVVVIMPSDRHDDPIVNNYTLQLLDAFGHPTEYMCDFTKATRSGTNNGKYTFDLDELAVAAEAAAAEEAAAAVESTTTAAVPTLAVSASTSYGVIRDEEGGGGAGGGKALSAGGEEVATKAAVPAPGSIRFVLVNSKSGNLFISQLLVYARGDAATNIARGKAVTGSGEADIGEFQNITDGQVSNRNSFQGLCITAANSWTAVDLSSAIDVERVVVIMSTNCQDNPITKNYSLQLLDASGQQLLYTRDFTEAIRSGTNNGTYTFV